jgi:hypothetical protein
MTLQPRFVAGIGRSSFLKDMSAFRYRGKVVSPLGRRFSVAAALGEKGLPLGPSYLALLNLRRSRNYRAKKSAHPEA